MKKALALAVSATALALSTGIGPAYGGETTVPPPEDPEITLEKTVGTTPGVCATTSEITVAPGTTVYYCYKVTNESPFTFTTHTLTDDTEGEIFVDHAYNLLPGASATTVALGVTVDAVINTTTTNTATWSACFELRGPDGQDPFEPICAEATASATVNVQAPTTTPAPTTTSTIRAATVTPRFTG